MGPDEVSSLPPQAWDNRLQALLPTLLLLLTCLWQSAAHAAQLHLSWIDASNDESGFEIERKTGKEGIFGQIATQGANLTLYTDDNLAPGTVYCYRVRAFNGFGKSGYSNEACATTSTIVATLETPENGQSVSGIALIRGWGFDIQADDRINGVDLLIDGTRAGSVPCCSPRSDVQAAFPQFPATNTENSGWGAVMNWGVLKAGTHTVQVQISNTAGGTWLTEPHTV